MNLENKYLLLIEQLSTDFKKNKKGDMPSSILLFRDYLTKLFRWRTQFGDDSEFIKTKESHNLFQYFSDDWTNSLKSVDDIIDDLKKHDIDVERGKYYDDALISYYINWSLFKDKKEIINIDLPHPYQSIIKVIFRTNIRISNGLFQIGNVTFLNREKYNDFLLPSLEDEFLSFIDSKITIIGKIPNQEETNMLWQEFQKIKNNG